MKTARTYIFMFVPIPPGWLSHEPMIPGLRAGSNGSSPPEQKHDDAARWRVRNPDGRRNTGATRSSVLDLVHRQSASAIQQMKTINMSIQKNSDSCLSNNRPPQFGFLGEPRVNVVGLNRLLNPLS